MILQKYIGEYQKCASDFGYFCEKYIRIRTQNGDLQDFKLYDFQKDVMKSVINNEKTFINKARQMGFTNLFTAYIMWNMIFKNNISVILCVIDGRMAERHREIFQEMFRTIPSYMKKDIVVNNKAEIEMKNGSNLHIRYQDGSLRGFNVDLLVFDEADFIKNFETRYTELIPCLVNPGSKLVAYSTMGGKGEFKDLFIKSVISNNITVPYHCHPEYDGAWYHNMKNAMGNLSAKVELDCEL